MSTRTALALPLAFAIASAIALAPARVRAQTAPPDPDPWFGHDKALHFTLSAAIAGGGYGTASLFTDQLAPRLVFGASLALAAGAGKELLDLAGFGDPSWRDFTWDVIGTAVGVGLALTFDLATKSPAPAR